MSGTRRVHLEPAFLLHHYPWRDTSRILELMTRTHGRVSVFSRASRQSGSTATGGALQPFTEALVSWSGRGEAGHLTAAERVRPPASLAGDRLMSGFYANELLLKLLQRNDPHPALFDAYAGLIERLFAAGHDPGRALRLFEKRLLDELGWGLNLEHEATSGELLLPERSYRYGIEGGAEPVDPVPRRLALLSGSDPYQLILRPGSIAPSRIRLRCSSKHLERSWRMCPWGASLTYFSR